MLRAQKNRFGPTNELAVFEMGSKGLEEVLNPSERFLEERASEMPGSAIVAQLEGTRPFLNEVQALVQNSYQGFPRRTNQGVDQNRISVLLAVLEKSLGARFSEQDVYCKVSCGAKIHESAADCALCMALLSALREEALPKDAIFIGEVGLGGEIRSVSGLSIRVEEALRTGFRRAFVPAHSAKEVKNLKGVSVVPVRNIQELQDTAFE